MWKQSMLAVAVLGMLVAASQAQVVIEVEAKEVKKAEVKKADENWGKLNNE